MSWNKQPELKNIESKKLIGMSRIMSFSRNLTGELWRSFMPRRREIQNAVSIDLVSMQVYPPHFDFSPETSFTKFAAVEVEDYEDIPRDMVRIEIPAGLYAIFHYKGLSTDTSVFEYIFRTWLPSSGYELDNRPHFELLGPKYKNGDPESEEDIFVPVRKR